MASHSEYPSPASRVSGRLPGTAPITQLGISVQAAKLLTAPAAKLTKWQVVELRENPGAAKSFGLGVQDLNSIRTAFTQPQDLNFGRQTAEFSISCCCCTPCCCAATALTGDAKVA